MTARKKATGFHGWSYQSTNLYVGRLPLRRAVALYTIRGSVLIVLAYFRNEHAARLAMNTIDTMSNSFVVQQ